MENKVFKVGKIIFNILLGIILVLFLIVVGLQRFSSNKISFFKYRMFTVVSGSMDPTYKVGDVLLSKEMDIDDIKVGDVVSYLGKAGDFKDKVVTHEVIEIETDQEGNKIFHTKGVANMIEDPVITGEQIYGVVKHKMFLLSLISRVVSTKYGFLIFIIVPIFYIVGSEILEAMLAKEEKRRKK